MREPFVEKVTRQKPGFNVGVILGSKTPQKGKVGIEIELEGKNFLYHENVPPPWVYKEDGSLRGEESAEYVLKNPIEFNEVEKVLKTLFDKLAEKKAKFDDSNRTSIHVHLNCQEFYLNRLAAFMGLWFCLEEILTQWCGEHRVGNLFCLRSRDATAIISQLRKFLKSDGKFELSDNLHYAGLNANALRKFGSLEIRTMRGVSDPDVIKDWVEILQRLYEYSAEFNDPRNVCSLFSGHGPLQYFYEVLGDKASCVRAGVNWTDEEIRASMYRGIRLAQDICYCRDWDLYRPQSLKPDPFKRDMKKVAKKVIGFDYEDNPSPFSMEAFQQYIQGATAGTVYVSGSDPWNNSVSFDLPN
jgi:hypothetical protein